MRKAKELRDKWKDNEAGIGGVRGTGLERAKTLYKEQLGLPILVKNEMEHMLFPSSFFFPAEPISVFSSHLHPLIVCVEWI